MLSISCCKAKVPRVAEGRQRKRLMRRSSTEDGRDGCRNLK
jgi:hypothetical protein